MDFLSERQKKVLRQRVLTGNVIYHINKLGGWCLCNFRELDLFLSNFSLNITYRILKCVVHRHGGFESRPVFEGMAFMWKVQVSVETESLDKSQQVNLGFRQKIKPWSQSRLSGCKHCQFSVMGWEISLETCKYCQ